MRYIVGARGSALSVAQTDWTVSRLRDANPGADYETRAIVTSGDRDSRPLFTIDQRGVFAKEIDRAVARGEVDFAVHSLKDVPSRLDSGLVLACVPKREAVNDVFVSDGSTLETVREGAIIGTSSLRRAVQISRKRPDVTVRPIRGNIETRIKKISAGYDGVVLARAGIDRLGLDVRYDILPTDEFSPSPGQGALALVARSGDADTIDMLQGIEDADSRLEVEAERALSEYVESGCRFPIGAYARSAGSEMTLTVTAFSVDGKKSVRVVATGPKEDPKSVGGDAGRQLQEKGVGDLALNWREKVAEWNER